ncbi:sodium- and chloride-dependent glycine transporter 1-like [Daphnia carinata]|uniref:sodium- and chloride-dependent glycine transporter 1-like n=1 Tax=Daphnia carinata TaxID=120202 RepID=UPI00257FCACE|nr:sodium- and chloride-dependent glycine transporter 1-like [Daphnia carinata]
MLPRARLAVERNTSTLTLTPVSLPRRSNISRLNQWESPVKSSAKCSVHWKCKWDFYVAILSFALDSASWTRLTSSCIEHGGAAYLVARVISIMIVGVPLLFFEISIGQLSGMGPLKFFGTTNLRPVFSGVGFFLMLTSVYKAIGDTASGMWPISKTITLMLGDDIKGLNSTLDLQENMYGFTQLDALTVISLSITWVFAVLAVICGVKFISKVAYVTSVVPVILITTLVVRAIYSDPLQMYAGLAAMLAPSWHKLLSVPLWITAIADTALSLNLGFGVITFLASLNTHKLNCLKSSIVLVTCHTVTLALMLVLSCSTVILFPNRSEMILEAISTGVSEQHPPGEGWTIIFFVAVFLLNLDTLIFICNMLATSFSNSSWRPVLAVLFGAFLYVICLPLATQSRELYIATIETFTGCILPLAGTFLVLVATVSSMRPSSMVDMVEFAGQCKLAFRGQSYVFVAYNAILPLMLLMCIVDAGVRTADNTNVMAIVGRLLLCFPWVSILLTPFYLVGRHYGHLPSTKKWRELWQKSDYEDWLYRRPQLPAGASDDDSNSIYELPERVSSSRPISTYYSSATILASDSAAVYSAYY